MKIQVLASVMNQEPKKIIKKMNIQTDAIIINQCNENNIEKLKFKNYNIKFYCK